MVRENVGGMGMMMSWMKVIESILPEALEVTKDRKYRASSPPSGERPVLRISVWKAIEHRCPEVDSGLLCL